MTTQDVQVGDEGKKVASKRQRWIDLGAGFLGWFIFNIIIWLIMLAIINQPKFSVPDPGMEGLNVYESIPYYFLAPAVNLIVVIVLVFLRRWALLGFVLAFIVNFVLSFFFQHDLILIFNHMFFGIPFFM